MPVESLSRDAGHQSFPLFTRSLLTKKNRTYILVAISVVVFLILMISVSNSRGNSDEVQDKGSFTGFDCTTIVDDIYYDHVVNDLSKNHFKRCIGGKGNKDCPCEDPSVGTRDTEHPRWNYTFQRNLDLLQDMTSYEQKLDVLMLGDSLIEHFLGTNYALHPAPDENGVKKWADVNELYLELFRGTGSVKGLALGVAEDGYSQLLYRIQNGELPENLDVPIIWLNIGINDIFYHACMSHAVVAGTMSIVDAIKETRNDTTKTRIVINSLVPTDRHMEQVRAANERLYCYAERTEGVEFFDVTPLFDIDDDDVFHRDNSLYFDRIHPNLEGYELWGNAIVNEVKRILSFLKLS